MPVTLEQIAKKSGVGKATVSRALRRTGSVSAKTREHIQRVAEELGYRPDPILSAFTQRRWKKRSATGTPLAFVFSSEKDVFSSECLKSAKARSAELGYELGVYRLSEFSSHAQASRVLYHRGVRGIIVAHQRKEETPVCLEWEHFAVVSCGLRQDRIPSSIVMPNVFNGMRLCAKVVCELGYRRPGVVFMDEGPDDNTAYQMGAYWQEFFGQIPFPSKKPFLPIPPLTDAKNFEEWFLQHRPDVILGSNLELFDALVSRGWRFPEEVPYVCFGWNNRRGAVAGVDLHTDLIGASLVDLLDVQIRSGQFGASANRVTHMIEPSWMGGRTLPTAPPFGAAPKGEGKRKREKW